MESKWNQSEMDSFVSSLCADGINEDLAVRTYTTRLLGQDPLLVLHGGGNTSVKTRMTDSLGSEVDVLCVKGSGWDMGTIEPPGLPAVELKPLAGLAKMPSLSDENLVAAQRRLLLDPYAPNPSIEAVLHAIIPHRHVDHTHANAILSLTNQPDGEDIIRDLFPDTTIVPYVMPGFALAKAVRRILDEEPKAIHMILMNHGIFTYHDDARQSYDDMISMCSLAERRLEDGGPRPFGAAELPKRTLKLSEIAPVVRGSLAQDSAVEGRPDRWILDFRSSDQILQFVNGRDLADYACRGNATPDHAIRVKRFGMTAPAPDASDLAGFKAGVQQAAAEFANEYNAYFERQNSRAGGGYVRLDPVPRIVYVPGVGLFGAGNTAKAAAVCADIAEATIDVITKAEGIGTFTALSENEMFDIEYWSLEQAKLAKTAEKPLNRQIAVVTGGGGGLGLAAARRLRSEGAEVALLDINAQSVEAAANELGALAVVCDVTSQESVESAVGRVAERFGGVDILISNAGAAFRGRMEDVDDRHFRDAFELNFWSHQYMARSCIKVMKAQGTGGALVFNVTKQVLNPGPDFGPYGASKSALMTLVRQYAIEHGADGITSNAVNADRIRTGLLTEDLIAERAKARGVGPDEYMRGNLIRREVTAGDVADAFVFLSQARKTTGAILTVDGGNTAAMVR